jgi:hypothetical protein
MRILDAFNSSPDVLHGHCDGRGSHIGPQGNTAFPLLSVTDRPQAVSSAWYHTHAAAAEFGDYAVAEIGAGGAGAHW